MFYPPSTSSLENYMFNYMLLYVLPSQNLSTLQNYYKYINPTIPNFGYNHAHLRNFGK